MRFDKVVRGYRATSSVARHVAVLATVLVVAPVPSMVVSSHNYTWSLLIFLLPIATILHWFVLTPEEEIGKSRRAFFATLGVLIPMGFVLNLLFADSFFLYPNPDATLGWSVPAIDFFSLDYDHPIPVEEFLFYASGFAMVLLLYVWGDETFFGRYKKTSNIEEIAGGIGPVVQFAPAPLAVAVVAVGAGWLLKAIWGDGEFPGYLAYLMVLPFVVTVTLYRVAAPNINWRAFLFMFVVLLVDSVTWEVTLALPNGWWSYQPGPMLGLFVGVWSDLPIEAVIVWLLTPIATVVTFEAAKVFFHHPEPKAVARLFKR